VLDRLERLPIQMQGQLRASSVAGQVALPMSQPSTKELMVGQGFAAARKFEEEMTPNAERTDIIRRRLADPRIRAIFPWWWWCCDDPNIVFSVNQGGNLIVDENPAFSTRWCLPDNSTVTLVGNEQTISSCPGDPKPVTGFVWTRVGNIVVPDISDGYADGSTGTDTSDMAFGGTLDIFGEFAAASGVSYYQINAGKWTGAENGNPSRGGTPPVSSTPISADLYNYVTILHTNLTVTNAYVKMGPFNAGGLTNLYATQEARAGVPAAVAAQLGPFPTVNAGDAVIWAYNGRKVYADAAALIGAGLGGVDLSVTGYNNAFAPVVLPANPQDTLTLMIDDTGLTTATINSLRAFRQNGTEVFFSGTGHCPAFEIGPNGYVELNITVRDANGHVFEYEITPQFGSGTTGTTIPGLRGYSQAPAGFPGAPYDAPNVGQKSFEGGTETIRFYPTEDCCYDFRLLVGKRVTSGYSFPSMGTATFQTASIKVT
jgi:hypothetical protein